MYNLRNIRQLKTNTLQIVQPKWYKFNYELTDDAFVYAKIYTTGFWHTTTLFETADEVLSIRNLWNGGFEMKNDRGNIVGDVERKVLSGVTTFTNNNGRKFIYKAPSVWRPDYVWTDEFGNELLRVTFTAFAGKTMINFNNRAAEIPDFYSLVFLAFKLKMDNAAHG